MNNVLTWMRRVAGGFGGVFNVEFCLMGYTATLDVAVAKPDHLQCKVSAQLRGLCADVGTDQETSLDRNSESKRSLKQESLCKISFCC